MIEPSHARPRGTGRAAALILVFAVAALALPTVAGAAPSLYWTYEDYAANSIGAILTGSLVSGSIPQTIFTEPEKTAPEGIAIDPATGKIYWADDEADEILVGGIGGAAEGPATTLIADAGTGTSGVAIDPSAGKIYWTDEGSGEIRSADLNGANVETLFQGESKPIDVAIDTSAGKLFWTDSGSGLIRVGGIGGAAAEGPATTLFQGEGEPAGIAVDPATGKIYWANASYGEIRAGGIGGVAVDGPATTLFQGEGEPVGVAVDPAAGKIYWTDWGSGLIRVGGIGGEGEGASAETLFSSAVKGPNFLALFDSPDGTGAPVVSGAGAVGQPLSCSQGSWAGDLEGVFFYQTPRSFAYQWQRDGTDLADSTGSSFTPSEVGSYACEVTASNQAGSTTQTSAAMLVQPPSPPTDGESKACNPAVSTTQTSAAMLVQSPSPPTDGGSKVAAKPPKSKIAIKAVRELVKDGKTSVTLACSGGVQCAGKVSLTTRVAVSSKHGEQKQSKRVETIVLARASYMVASGKHKTVTLSLNDKALALLSKASGHRLSVRIQTTVKDATTVHCSVVLRLKPSAKQGKTSGIR